MNRSLNIVLCLIAVFAMASCSSSRKAGVGAAPADVPARGGAPAMRAEIVNALGATYSDWSDFYGSFTLRTQAPFNFSISGRATMTSGEAILLSMRMFGMEVATVYVNNDSAWVADKYHKNLCAVPLASLTARTDLTVADVQELLLGQAFYPGRGALRSDGFDRLFSPVEDVDGGLILSPRRVPAGAQWYFTVNESFPVLTGITVITDATGPFALAYSDQVDSSVAGMVASQLKLDGKIGSHPLEGSLSWDMNKASWNNGRSADRPSYKGYKRLSVAEFLTALKSF